jgi:hypothetical protein
MPKNRRTPMHAVQLAPPTVLETMHSVFVARALYVVTDLGIPDLLAGGPRSCTDLADKVAVEAIPLHQVLRTIASTGLLHTEPGPESGPQKRYALTDSGRTLLNGHPSGTRDLILTMQGPTFWNCLDVLPERITTGRTGPEIAYGTPFFDHLRNHSHEADRFNRMMIATHGNESFVAACAYDFSWAHHVVDVGGGIGTLLLAVLGEHPHLTGTLFDLPEVAAHAQAHLADREMLDRCDVASGSFLESVPPGADVYLLCRILHDWDDDTSARILRTCAEAMSPNSRLLIVEKVLPEGDEPHLGKMLDLVMLTLTNGRERTAEEYRQLLTSAGMRPQRLLPTGSASSIIEAVRDA